MLWNFRILQIFNVVFESPYIPLGLCNRVSLNFCFQSNIAIAIRLSSSPESFQILYSLKNYYTEVTEMIKISFSDSSVLINIIYN